MASRPVSWADIPVEWSVRRLSWVNMRAFDDEDAADDEADAGNTTGGGSSVPEAQRSDTPDEAPPASSVTGSPAVVAAANAAVDAAAGSTTGAVDGFMIPRAERYKKRQDVRRRLLEAATPAAPLASEIPVRRSRRKSMPRRIAHPE